jgi:peptidoglycan/LPS O-acetylase OafA/YrhL
VLVLLFHGGVSWAGGGFFGVDVFFVLSGFLITGLLTAELRGSGTLSLRRFWAHRVRRLLPALLLVLAAVAVWAAFELPSDTLGQLRGDAVATLLYVNNWHQMAGGTGYFADLNTPRPLLHTWSLSIEEQFYLVWPLVVLAVLKVTRSTRALLGVASVGAVASAVAMVALYRHGASQSRLYYGTDTRAQALLIGAALALVLAPTGDPTTGGPLVRGTARTTTGRTLLGILGLVGLAVVLVLTDVVGSTSTWIYEGGFTLVAVASAALIAAVVLVPDGPLGRLLSLRPVRYVGAISYGLYLWHWPLFVALDADRTGLTGWPLFAVRVAAALAAAVASYHLVELPVRRGALRRFHPAVLGPAAVGLTVAVLLIGTADATPAVNAGAAAAMSRATLNRTASREAAVPLAPDTRTGPIRLLVVGDSEASFLSFGLAPPAGSYGVAYAGDGVFGCGLLYTYTEFHGTIAPQAIGARGGRTGVLCVDQPVRWRADLHAFHPDVVVLVEGEYEVRDQLIGSRWLHLGLPRFDALELAALRRDVALLGSTGATVVLLTAPYYHQQAQLDGAPWPEDDPARVDRFNHLLAEVARGSRGRVVVEDLNRVLDPAGTYTDTVDGQTVRFADGIHVTPAAGRIVARWLLPRVVALGDERRARAPVTTTP